MAHFVPTSLLSVRRFMPLLMDQLCFFSLHNGPQRSRCRAGADFFLFPLDFLPCALSPILSAFLFFSLREIEWPNETDLDESPPVCLLWSFSRCVAIRLPSLCKVGILRADLCKPIFLLLTVSV